MDTIIGRVGERGLPWAMALIAALIGLPLFFEVGVVLLVPVVLLVARRTGVSLLKVGIPALAGLSVLHGLVPPHPGPLAAISSLRPTSARRCCFGLLIAIPTLIVSGPVLATILARWVPVHAGPAGHGRERRGRLGGCRWAARSARSARWTHGPADRSRSVRPQAPGGSRGSGGCPGLRVIGPTAHPPAQSPPRSSRSLLPVC